MPCGCKKNKVTPTLAAGETRTPLQTGARVYDIMSPEGALVASSTNIVFARVEARRTGGTVVPREVVAVSETV